MGLNEKFFKTSAVDDTPNFAPTIWTGNDTARNISTGFAPDFVWIKSRTAARNHYLYDSIRGVNNQLLTNATSAQANIGERLTAFNSDSFRIGTSSEVNNASTEKYVGWAWKAGGADVLNEEGTIDSQVSANVDAGFSIVTNKTSDSEHTVGHGLNAAPELIISKSLSSTYDWNVWVNGFSDYQGISLNNSNARYTNGGFRTVYSTSTTTMGFGLQFLSATNYGANTDIVNYCFHSVSGYQKVGSYSGNQSLNTANQINFGFTPRFVLIKNTTNSGSQWMMFDSVRTNGIALYANTADAASDYSTDLLLSSQGLEFKSTNINVNQSGATYIYLAIA